jgi:hypothetical protein
MDNDTENNGSHKPPSRVIDPGKNVLDLTGLSEEQAQELQRQFTAARLDLERKAAEAKIDVGALTSTLETFNDEAAKATQANVSVTISHRQKTSIGETEIVMGNTERAAAGKLSMSASGLTNKLPLIFGIIVVGLVAVVVLLSRH